MTLVRTESTNVVEPDAEDDPAPHGAGESEAEGKITTAVRDIGDRLVYESADMPGKAPIRKEKAVVVNVIDSSGDDGKLYPRRGLKGNSCSATQTRGVNMCARCGVANPTSDPMVTPDSINSQ